MSFLTILQKMAELFIIILVGFAANKLKIMGEAANKSLTKIVLNVCMPCYMLASVFSGSALPSNGEIFFYILVAFITSGIQLVVAVLLPKAMGLEKRDRGVYSFMLAFGNVGFIGYPAVTAIFGGDAVFVNSVLTLPFNLLSYTLGVYFLIGKSQGKLDIKRLITPCLVGSLAALILAFAKPPMPGLVVNVLSLVGQITTPAALLIIGSMLATMPFREMFGGWRIYLVTAVRLLIVPIALFFILRTFVSNTLLLGCAVIVCGMPIASNGTMLSLEYGADSKLMTKATFVTTVFSVITISVLAMLVG